MPDDPKPDDAQRAKAEAQDAFLDRLVAIVVMELIAATTEPTSEPRNEAIRERQELTE